MKQVWSYKHVFWLALFAAALAPNLAKAAKAPCETKAEAVYKKKAIEAEMALIAGNVSEIEVSTTKESLQAGLKRDRESCIRKLSSRSARAEAAATAL